MEDALAFGGACISLLNHADRVKSACLAQLVNAIAPIMTETGGPAWRQTIFHPFAQTARHARGTVLDLRLDAPTLATAKYGEVPVLDSLLVVAYNAHIGEGDLVRLVEDIRNGTLTGVLFLDLDGFAPQLHSPPERGHQLADMLAEPGIAHAHLAVLGVHPESGKDLKVMEGRYGPYVSDGTIHATLPKSADPSAVTLEEGIALIDGADFSRDALRASALAFADRGRYLGDPRAMEPGVLRQILSQPFADERFCEINPLQAAPKPVAFHADDLMPWERARLAAERAGPAGREAALRRFAEVVTARKDALARLISGEAGKPLWEAAAEAAALARRKARVPPAPRLATAKG